MGWLRKASTLFHKRALESDMAEEMHLHIELQTELNRKAGMAADEAHDAALRQFGNVARIQEQARAGRSGVWVEQLVRDGLHGVRAMCRSPGFALLAALALALGMGLNLAVFALGSAVLLRPLPGLRAPDQLVVMGRHLQVGGTSGVSYPGFLECRAGVPALSEIAAYREAPFSLAEGQRTERLMGEFVSGSYFRTLGVPLAAGRDFRPDEDAVPGRNPVAIISHRLWQQRWQGDLGVVGREVMINGHALVIVGVAAAGYRAVQLPTAHDLWVPLQMRAVLQTVRADPFTSRESYWLQRVVGRLAPGATLEQVRAQLAAVASHDAQQATAPRDNPWTYFARAYSPFPGSDARGPRLFLGALAAITVLVLLVVAANVASLFLARALARRREVAVRLALGASRWRVVRQFLAEGLAVALTAGVFGWLAANFAADWIVRQIPGEDGETPALAIVMDWRLVLAGLGLVALATLAVGLLPAWQGSRVDLLTTLKSGEAGQSGRRSRLRATLVVVQIALCAVLLVAAGLMYRSQQALEQADPALPTDPLLLARLDPAINGYDASRGQALYTGLLERLRAQPNVKGAGLAALAPFAEGSLSYGEVKATAAAGATSWAANANLVSGGYFESLGLGLLRGRDFERADGPAAPAVVIVNRTLAQNLWPNGDGVGHLLYFSDREEPARLVVGIVGDDPLLRSPRAPDEARPVYYLPLAQRPFQAASLLLRTAGDPAALLPFVRTALGELDPNVPLFQVGTLDGVRSRTLWQQRVIGRMVLAGSAAAVLLALLGLYAAVAHEVARRQREIGIRIAIGANHSAVLGLVLRQGLQLAAFGLVLGLGASLAVTRLFRSFLVGVSASDPLTLAVAVAGLAAFSAIACWLPARRATKVDPILALRTE